MTKAVTRSSRKRYPGERFGKLTALAFVGYSQTARPKALWRYRCDCGNELVIRSESVSSGNTKSCGCHKKAVAQAWGRANKKHGRSESRIYRIWGAMHRRCENPKNSRFEYYGGRGIRVCEEWSSLETFREWALANGYADNLTIDRYPDKNGNYEPGNCRWITIEDQQRNRRPPAKRRKAA